MANWNPIKVYNTDTFKEWRDKFNTILDYLEVNDQTIVDLQNTINNNYFEAYVKENLPLKVDNTPVEIKQITVQEGYEWYLDIERFASYGMKIELVLIHEAVTNVNPNRVLQYPSDWYFNDNGNIVMNTPLLNGDIISVRSYGLVEGKEWTDYYAHKFNKRVGDSDYIVDNVNNTTDVFFGYPFEADTAKVYLNGVLLNDNDYTNYVGGVIVNSILSIDDIVTVELKMRLVDIAKYQYFVNYVTRDNVELIKSILDSQSLIQWEWMVDNYSDILNPNVDVPTLNDAEYIRRSILAKSSNLGSLNIK